MTQLLRTSSFHKDNMSRVLQNKITIHPAFILVRSSLCIPECWIETTVFSRSVARWPVESCWSRGAQTCPSPNQISHEVAKWTSAENLLSCMGKYLRKRNFHLHENIAYSTHIHHNCLRRRRHCKKIMCSNLNINVFLLFGNPNFQGGGGLTWLGWVTFFWKSAEKNILDISSKETFFCLKIFVSDIFSHLKDVTWSKFELKRPRLSAPVGFVSNWFFHRRTGFVFRKYPEYWFVHLLILISWWWNCSSQVSRLYHLPSFLSLPAGCLPRVCHLLGGHLHKDEPGVGGGRNLGVLSWPPCYRWQTFLLLFSLAGSAHRPQLAEL